MNEFEKQLTEIAKGMDYPPTPDIAGFVSARLRPARSPRLISKTWAWSLTIALILLLSLLLIPPARAAILEFIQIGIVRIFPQPIEPTAEPIQTIAPSTATPISSLPFLETIAGKTTLADAQKRVNYPILLPAYPADIGEPDYVFVQNADGNMTILVWLDPQNPESVLMSLHFVPPGSWAITKVSPTLIEETTVDGVRAIWAVGPYPLRFTNGDLDFTRIVNGNVLIWADDTVTYRLETDLSLEEALKIAESLEP
ncbi:MAG: hypothetical protein DPW18_14830 [Chloroflexi bacterium]|nr:hypothetical protein [Chloroflexota bacterium]MDL1942298.1 hypothetical protein [Chloroflexi bacterium CFX2]